MECNKDEALRAKKIAERKVTERDYAGAKKFALKAQNLFPELEGIRQLLTTIDLYISVEKKVNGEVDWYTVLGISPWVDDETARTQYQKLVMALHPDNNQAVGADGAFKLVSEAWSLLSDEAKRIAYNEKLNPKIQSKHPVQSGFSNHTSTANVTSLDRSHDNTPRTSPASAPAPAPSPSTQNPGTFWTICNKCNTQFEYLRIYVNHNLLCPNCRQAFLAVERPPPSNALKSTKSTHHATNSNLHHSSNNTNLRWGPFFRKSGGNSKNASPSNVTQAAASVVQQAHEKYKREREEAQAGLKKRRIIDNRINGYVSDMAMRNGVGSGSISDYRKGSFEAEGTHGFYGINNKPNSRRELSLLETRNMLMSKARVEIRKILENSRLETNAKTNRDKMKMKEKESKKQKNMDNGDFRDPGEHDGSNVKIQNKQSLPGYSGGDSDKNVPAVSITVPDSDFHNFDLDRTESSFGGDQVWAAYDDDDGMPRFYARIHKVISLKPFRMQISWLNSRSNSELGPVHWIDSGFTKTCGDFRAGKHEISETLNSFSHKVKWIKGKRGVVRIFPSKGDIWALYRNWSPDWNENTPDEVIHKYDMVEVLDDYSDEQGVSVTPLVKVDGFRTVFRKHMDPKEVQRIPRGEMFRFSHQVPSHLLTGQEAQNAPAGCWDLDPAATLLELIQVSTTTEANETPVVDKGVRLEEEILQQIIC
ncbi:hypothetical protein Ddye_013998 [Dipteronia dyeriana]|uniref:J domain-containing protein n=1 Tax=Dipteronia dyeriana TaxID=168575 RepID=A0AAD9X7E7_9ROSI|nr:hypothetical protein Ddye_013998 [Dipteronia dyeriana]